MADRLSLLKRFYGCLPRDRVKLETSRHGFAFLDRLLAHGARLDYGELTLTRTLHKYKLSGVPERQFDELLADHLAKVCNVCLYFGARENALFCFNLDNNRIANNTEIIPEMALAIRAVRDELAAAGLPPLVIASGRGYHAWCRLSRPVENAKLHRFMLEVAVQAAARIHRAGGDRRRVKFNFYPDPRTDNAVSLRLFGSVHAKNGVFSRILAGEALLDEEASWNYFENHARHEPAFPR